MFEITDSDVEIQRENGQPVALRFLQLQPGPLADHVERTRAYGDRSARTTERQRLRDEPGTRGFELRVIGAAVVAVTLAVERPALSGRRPAFRASTRHGVRPTCLVD